MIVRILQISFRDTFWENKELFLDKWVYVELYEPDSGTSYWKCSFILEEDRENAGRKYQGTHIPSQNIFYIFKDSAILSEPLEL